jgi:hypothetical protein
LRDALGELEAEEKVIAMVLKPLAGERLKCRFSYWE